MHCRAHLLHFALTIPMLAACPADDGSDDGSDEASSSGAPGSSSGGDDSSSGAASSSGADESSSSGAAAIDYLADIQPIWNAACTCHLQGPSGTMTATVLTLNEDVSYDNLVGVAAEQAALSRIEPGDPAASYVWHKLNGTQEDVGGSGTAMPQIGMLDDQQRATIEAWISQGAPL